MTNCRRTVSGEGYNPKKEEWEGRRDNHHMTIRQEPERPEMRKHWRRDPKKEEERTKSRMQNQKEGVVAWASRVREKTRIQERRSKLGSVGRQAVGERRVESKPEHESMSIT